MLKKNKTNIVLSKISALLLLILFAASPLTTIAIEQNDTCSSSCPMHDVSKKFGTLRIENSHDKENHSCEKMPSGEMPQCKEHNSKIRLFDYSLITENRIQSNEKFFSNEISYKTSSLKLPSEKFAFFTERNSSRNPYEKLSVVLLI